MYDKKILKFLEDTYLNLPCCHENTPNKYHTFHCGMKYLKQTFNIKLLSYTSLLIIFKVNQV